MSDNNLYEEFRQKRKRQQNEGVLPEWFTTNALLTFETKYLYQAENYREQLTRICDTLASYTDDKKYWFDKFFNVVWNGHLALSSPVMSNTGTDRGLSVSCSGGVTADSIEGFFDSYKEVAVLSKNGFGTSSYVGGVRPRGSEVSKGKTKADGVIPVIIGLTSTVRQVSQGASRRGAGAWYLDIDHNDFDELCGYALNNPDDLNIGWNVSDEFIERLKSNDKEAVSRYCRAMKLKMITGKGYFFFIDRANRMASQAIKNSGISIKASNLCSEIALSSDKDHTFSCVLSSMNLSKYDEWKDTDAVFTSTVLLDCVAEDLIQKAKGNKSLEAVVRFTEKFRALGLGLLGFHTYLQDKMIEFDEIEAFIINQNIFREIREKAEDASRWMGEEWGIPEFCKGTGMRNATLMAVAPNTTSALICGSVSQGIEPFYKNVFTQGSAAGDMYRVNPSLLNLLKSKNKNDKSVIQSIIDNKGSVSHLDFLSKKEKSVFKTAFEIDQVNIIKLASQRQKYIDQAQSLNLFFSADEDEEYIGAVHGKAFLDENIKSLYYVRSEAGVDAAKSDCLACEG